MKIHVADADYPHSIAAAYEPTYHTRNISFFLSLHSHFGSFSRFDRARALNPFSPRIQSNQWDLRWQLAVRSSSCPFLTHDTAAAPRFRTSRIGCGERNTGLCNLVGYSIMKTVYYEMRVRVHLTITARFSIAITDSPSQFVRFSWWFSQAKLWQWGGFSIFIKGETKGRKKQHGGIIEAEH